ncbi:MAG: hypothetical protein OSA39_03445 [Sphingobium sp.]|nr:hypothetical protein [Sphingobium sp.]
MQIFRSALGGHNDVRQSTLRLISISLGNLRVAGHILHSLRLGDDRRRDMHGDGGTGSVQQFFGNVPVHIYPPQNSLTGCLLFVDIPDIPELCNIFLQWYDRNRQKPLSQDANFLPNEYQRIQDPNMATPSAVTRDPQTTGSHAGRLA